MSDTSRFESSSLDVELEFESEDIVRKDFRIPVQDTDQNMVSLESLTCRLRDISEGGFSIIVTNGSPGPVGQIYDMLLHLEGRSFPVKAKLMHVTLNLEAEESEGISTICGFALCRPEGEIRTQLFAIIEKWRDEYLHQTEK